MYYNLHFSIATYSPSQSADLSTLFDVGGIFGGIAAGIFSDMFGKSACTCAVMLFLAIPSVYIILNLFCPKILKNKIILFSALCLQFVVFGQFNCEHCLVSGCWWSG